ncbi:MAG: hypothetical protein QM758_10840 [Armatimonas sp.]
MKRYSDAMKRLLSRLTVSSTTERKIDKLVRTTGMLRSASERCLTVVGPTLPFLEGTANNSLLAGAANLPLIGGAARADAGVGPKRDPRSGDRPLLAELR